MRLSQSNSKNERITTVVGTVLAVAILGAVVTAKHAGHSPRGELTQLESDLRLQLDMAFRHDTNQLDARVDRLNGVLTDWKQSTQSGEDRQRLVLWLRSAIRRSMPGSNQPLPLAPQFSSPEPVVAKVSAGTFAVESAAAVEPANPTTSNNEPSFHSPVQEVQTGIARMAESTTADVPTAPAVDVVTRKATAGAAPSQPAMSTAKVLTASAKPLSVSSGAFLQRTSSQQKAVRQKAVQRQPTVYVNLSDLAARIAGYHDSLDEVEAALFRLPNQNLAAAQQPLRKLQQLASDYHFVKLYYDTLTEQERRTIVAPRSLLHVCDRFSRCLDQMAAARDGDFLRPFDTKASAALNSQLNDLRNGLKAVFDRIAG